MEKFTKILLVIVILGWVLGFSSFLLSEILPIDQFYLILQLTIPILTGLLVAIFFFLSKRIQMIWNEKNKIKQFFCVVGGLLLVAIVVIISWLLFLLGGLFNGSYST